MIIHQGNNWLAVDKPAGLATHAGKPGELGAVEWLELHLGLKTHVVSRLDRGTSGVLLLAMDPGASARAEDIHESGDATKIYEFYSAVDSLTNRSEETWTRDDALDGKAALTSFQRLAKTPRGDLFRYRAEIARGRRHQIRRHAAASGVPVLGDEEYGGAKFPRLMLHCAEVNWPEIDDPLCAPAPASFTALAAGEDHAFAVCRDRRGDWPAAVADAFRVVHRDEIPGLPAAVDVFGDWFNAIWFDETSSAEKLTKLLHPILDEVAAAHGCRGGIIRTHRRNPHQRALVVETKVIGETPPEFFTVNEHGLKYEVSLTKTQHVGLFLDQRDTRRRLALAAAGKRLANLFAYTCSFSVAAVAAEAEVAFSVDTAKAGLNTGKNNFALNGLAEGGRGKFIQEDARKWLRRQERRRDEKPGEFQPLDLVVCDPPVFAAAKDGGKFSLETEWPRLAAQAAGLLGPDGVAVFANNHRSGDHAFYRRELEKNFGEVTDLRPPLDFPVFPRRPHHVRTFWCVK
ncbi:MAG: class I SAM-dependent methyltransferase [Candidatus Krumholzibacteriota bacterium]